MTSTRDITFPLLDAEEVGAMLGGVPAKTVLRYAREGRLPVVIVGKHRRFCREQVAAAIANAARTGRPV